MSIKSGYKQTEIGVIPEDWEVVELGEILEYEQPTKYLVETENYNINFNIPVLTAGKTFILGYTNETNGIYNDLPVIIFDDFTTASKYVDFPFKAKSSAMKILKIKDKSYPTKLLYEYIQNLDFIASTHKRYWISEYSKIKIPFPPLEEQKKIADILSTVDKKIAFIEENINATEELKKSLMQKLLTEGIGHTEFKDSELGRIPESWEIDKLENLTTKIGDGLHGTPKYVEQSDCYFINGNNLNGKSIEINKNTKCVNEEEYIKNKKILDNTTILLSINGTVGSLAYYNNENVMLGKSVAYMNVNSKILKQFLFYLLKSSKILEYFILELTGTTIKNLSLKTIRNTRIPLPQLEEQKQIAEILLIVDKKLESLKEKKQSFEELKKGLMQKLLTGKVRV